MSEAINSLYKNTFSLASLDVIEGKPGKVYFCYKELRFAPINLREGKVHNFPNNLISSIEDWLIKYRENYVNLSILLN